MTSSQDALVRGRPCTRPAFARDGHRTVKHEAGRHTRPDLGKPVMIRPGGAALDHTEAERRGADGG